MRPLLSLILVFCFSSSAIAQETLTKALAQQYFNAIEQLQQLQQQYPELDKQMDDFSYTDKTKFLSKVQELSFYPQINSAIQTAGLSGVEQLYDLSMRIIGGVMAVQMEQMPSGENIDALLAMKQQAVEQMQKANMPKEVREKMLKTLEEQEKNMMGMLKMGKNVSPEDKKFIKENLDWVMANMPEDHDDN
ncbi:hypothetical protein [Thalassotalea profundi]|uniref:Uncharacterized protein n=1 Tax=Thalassotalea profundi TaxID=2036687 RepID=A0ABQ3ICK4_9GAMM|nr:hypothetical protein [Thalassotalea profundi]GHE79129.1 hypothetical protein GCM10011501_03830 [Thalassotalea profundi]